jgi:hypothetical protein
MSPAAYHAQQEPWRFFCTLTFAGKLPAPALAVALQMRWLERSAKLLRTDLDQLAWLSREELGETNGRLHLHVLLGELSDADRVNSRTCLALMAKWETVTEGRLGLAGMARVRVFEPNLRGANYVLKGLDEVGDWCLRGANVYEVRKFDGSIGRTVRLARHVLVRWGREKGNKYGQQARSMRDAASVKCVQL